LGSEAIFGLAGAGISGVMEALRKRQNDVRFVQVRHEEAAIFMAYVYAKHTGKLGCSPASSGRGGGIYRLNRLNGRVQNLVPGEIPTPSRQLLASRVYGNSPLCREDTAAGEYRFALRAAACAAIPTTASESQSRTRCFCPIAVL
jgi:hypothetical protein